MWFCLKNIVMYGIVKYIIDAHFDLLTDVAVRRKNGVLDMKEHNYSDERISLLAGKNWLYAFEKILKK